MQPPPPRPHHLRPLERAGQPLLGPWPLCTCAEDASCSPLSVPGVSETTEMCNSISYQLVSLLRLALGWGTTPLPLLHLQTPTHPSSPSSKAAFARKPSLTTSLKPSSIAASLGAHSPVGPAWAARGLPGACSLRLTRSSEDRDVQAGLSAGSPGSAHRWGQWLEESASQATLSLPELPGQAGGRQQTRQGTGADGG